MQISIEALGWAKDESCLPLQGRLQYAQPVDTNWKKPFTGKMNPAAAALVVQSSEELPVITANKELIFPQDTECIKDASLILLKDAGKSKLSLARVSD